jgi:3-deoxy-manno-octulosonate cytidylyltransferase (CMP-KDO synthetase)
MKAYIFIPVRLDSNRLPQKPLAQIGSRPLVSFAIEKAVSSNIGPVYVPCCSKILFPVIESYGALPVLTDPNISCGTDRIFDAITQLQSQGKKIDSSDVIINLQGDLPVFDPIVLTQLFDVFQNTETEETDIATPVIDIIESQKTKNCVTVALEKLKNEKNTLDVDYYRAFYFSRQSLFYKSLHLARHIGIYGFTYRALEKFAKALPATLEQTESLEQLRAFSLDLKITCFFVNKNSKFFSVDDHDDLVKVSQYLKSNNQL